MHSCYGAFMLYLVATAEKWAGRVSPTAATKAKTSNELLLEEIDESSLIEVHE